MADAALPRRTRDWLAALDAWLAVTVALLRLWDTLSPDEQAAVPPTILALLEEFLAQLASRGLGAGNDRVTGS